MITHADSLRLIAWANAQRGLAFAWGATDCIALGVQAVGIITQDAPAPACPAWANEAEAREAAAQQSPSAWLMAAGFESVPVGGAQLGDIMIAPADGFPESAHVVMGKYALTASPEHGVGYVRTSDLRKLAATCWRWP